MLRFHQDGAEAGYGVSRIDRNRCLPSVLWKEMGGKFCQGKVKVAFSDFVEEGLGEDGGGFGGGSVDAPEDDVELWSGDGGDELRGLGGATGKFDGGGGGWFQGMREKARGG